MAIQVRLDLTPSEFDRVRSALTTQAKLQMSIYEDRENAADLRHKARQEAVLLTDLAEKLNK